jgi:hypothetical protein
MQLNIILLIFTIVLFIISFLIILHIQNIVGDNTKSNLLPIIILIKKPSTDDEDDSARDKRLKQEGIENTMLYAAICVIALVASYFIWKNMGGAN